MPGSEHCTSLRKMRRGCVLLKKLPKSGCCASHSEGAGPTDRGLLSRGSHRAPVPRRRAPQLRAPQLTAREASPGSQAALRRECLAGQPSLEYRDRKPTRKITNGR